MEKLYGEFERCIIKEVMVISADFLKLFCDILQFLLEFDHNSV